MTRCSTTRDCCGTSAILPAEPVARPQDLSPYQGGKLHVHSVGEWAGGDAASEGGVTAFDCDVEQRQHSCRLNNCGEIAVDNTRLADGVQALNMDWWNYGGLTRDVSLIDVPAKYIDDYDLHLNRERTAIEGSVHVEGGATGRGRCTVSLAELGRRRHGED